MVEIILADVKMPPLNERRYSKKVIQLGKWGVFDKEKFPQIIYEGNYENACLICHNLNKKHYLKNRILPQQHSSKRQ